MQESGRSIDWEFLASTKNAQHRENRFPRLEPVPQKHAAVVEAILCGTEKIKAIGAPAALPGTHEGGRSATAAYDAS